MDRAGCEYGVIPPERTRPPLGGKMARIILVGTLRFPTIVVELDCLRDEMVLVSTHDLFSSESWIVRVERWALPSRLMEL